MNLTLFNVQSFAYQLERFLVRDRIIIYLLGAAVACLTVMGASLIYLMGNLIIPVVCTVMCVVGVQGYVLKNLKGTTTETVDKLSGLYLTKTQRFIIDTYTDSSVALVLLACRQKDFVRLENVLKFMSQDYGQDYLYDWLVQEVCPQLSARETKWLWSTVTGKS